MTKIRLSKDLIELTAMPNKTSSDVTLNNEDDSETRVEKKPRLTLTLTVSEMVHRLIVRITVINN